MEATAQPQRGGRGRSPRPSALTNEQIWTKLRAECIDVLPWVMGWCGEDEGIAWEAMFRVGRMWRPDGGASLRTYVRSWAKHEALRLYRGGGSRHGTGGVQASYSILTNAKRTFGQDRDGNDLELEDLVSDAAVGSAFEWDDIEVLEWALRQVSVKERVVLRARFFEGKTLRAIGVELRLTPEAVRQRQDRGLRRMRALIEDRRVRIARIALGA